MVGAEEDVGITAGAEAEAANQKFLTQHTLSGVSTASVNCGSR